MLRTEILFIKRTKVAVHDTRDFRLIDQFGYFALIVFCHRTTPSRWPAMPLAGALDDRQRRRRPSSFRRH